MRSALTLLLFASCVGCFNTSSGPMTDERIAIVANTRIQSASVTFPDRTAVSIPPDDYELFRALFRTLAPIDSATPSPRLDTLLDYRLSLSAAGNFAIIDVAIGEDHLTYTLDGYKYQGGHPDQFVSAANSILELKIED